MSSPTLTPAPGPSSKKAESALATRIFINQVPEYDALAMCAEKEVSTIVRNMANGCGDGSRTTSYACFCYDSSTHFASLIAQHVRTACADDGDGPTQAQAQATGAVDVFTKYCQLGVTTGGVIVAAASAPTASMSGGNSAANPTTIVSTSSAMSDQAASNTQSPALLHSTALSPASSGPSTSSPSTSTNSSSTPAGTIAAAVSVPVILIALLISGLLFWRRSRSQSRKAAQHAVMVGGSQQQQPPPNWDDKRGYRVSSSARDAEFPGTGTGTGTGTGAAAVELAAAREKGPYSVTELPVPVHGNRYSMAELPGHHGLDQAQVRVAELEAQRYR